VRFAFKMPPQDLPPPHTLAVLEPLASALSDLSWPRWRTPRRWNAPGSSTSASTASTSTSPAASTRPTHRG